MLKINKNAINLIIVGVGGTGSHLTSFITHLIGNSKEKSRIKMTLIDGDVV